MDITIVVNALIQVLKVKLHGVTDHSKDAYLQSACADGGSIITSDGRGDEHRG
jgi:hypothetical protein